MTIRVAGYALAAAIALLLWLAPPAHADMLIETTDGRSYTVPVEADDVVSVEFTEPAAQKPAELHAPARTSSASPQSMKLFAMLPETSSTRFQSPADSELRVESAKYEAMPRQMAPRFERYLTIERGQTCALAADPGGKRGWSIDNFLLFEAVSAEGTVRFVIGKTDPVSYGGEPLERLGGLALTHPPGETDICRMLPSGAPFTLRVSAIDYGGVGLMSDIYLIIK